MISEKQLKEFKMLYKKHFNKDISDEEAHDEATSLLTLMKHIYKPIKKSDIEKLEKKRKETQ